VTAGAGVLLLAHGTPDSLEDMPEYLTRVRGGRPPSPALIEEMTHNYAAIGGRSPLTDITRAQGLALTRELGLPVYVGMRNWHPFIADAIASARSDGVRLLVAIPLAPQYSTLSVAKYQAAVEAVNASELTVRFVSAWYDQPTLLAAFAERLATSQETFLPDVVLFTAHSLPRRVVDAGDPYPEHVRATATALASARGLKKPRIVYQSAGRTDEPWLGPTIEQGLAAVAEEGARRVLLCPVGFVCDHTEILYDLDVVAARFARERGLELARTESLNTSPTFIRALADLAKGQLG
jgi:ferrochelatase